MFDFFKSKKSHIRQAVEQSGGVRHTWFEWSLENEVLRPILVIECREELDPGHPSFVRESLDQIRDIVAATDKPHPTIRIIPVRVWD